MFAIKHDTFCNGLTILISMDYLLLASADFLVVLGEGLAVVSGELNSSFSIVVGNLNMSHKVSELNDVQVGVPLSRGQGKPVRSVIRQREIFEK